MIEFVRVSKRFGSKQVLDEMSFSIRRGEIAFLLGRSGVGKSVTLKHIVGLLRPDSGDVRVDGRSVVGLSEEELLPIRRKCGMIFQFPALLDSLSVFDNIAFGPRVAGEKAHSRLSKIVAEHLEQVNLPAQVGAKFPRELSFGMQKRVSIARALALHPTYLLFDEPTTGLDPVSTAGVYALIAELSKKLHVTSMVISHDMKGALDTADRILVVDKGKIVDEGPPSEIQKSEHPLTSTFFEAST